MKKVAFLTIDSLENFESYDFLLINPFNKAGWEVEEISWRKENINWNNYSAVIIRSTWDYQNDYKNFLKVLKSIDKSSAVLFNDLETIKWNMNKSYLLELQKKGVNVVSTIWDKNFTAEKLKNYFNVLCSDEIIIKPTISANADKTYHLKQENVLSIDPTLFAVFKNLGYMAQPFMKNILSEGEYSLFYFDGKYSHAILKTPKENDFRVQEEHGGHLNPIKANSRQRKIAEQIISNLDNIPLYARVDLVRDSKNNFALMELELIEPSLYFHLDNASPQKFTKAFCKRMGNYKPI